MSEESNPAGSSSLSGATALITGSTRGLGRTTAERLLARGANLILSGRDQQAVDAAVDELSGHGPHVLGFAADLSNLASTHALAQNAMSAFGRIDILVNNAGMSRRGHFWDVTDADWDEQVNVNLRSPFILAQHVARRMIERGTRGRIEIGRAS
ncbi:MAG: SDR family NAD(P)-dependent oxidoreductase, partial [Thermomicrobiales bacterium]